MVMRFDPFAEFDRLAEQVAARREPRSFPLDAYRRGDDFYLHFDLPGIGLGDIELTAEQNVLTVKAERRWQREPSDEVVVQERPEGTFARQVFLSELLDVAQIEASYDQGVLTLRIPVKQKARPRRIEIGGSGGGPETIEPVSRPSE
jgi:HSP20 family protein